MKGLVLAGGEGTRLRPFTHSGSKQLVPIANRPVLFHAVDRLVEAGVDEVAIVVAPPTQAEIRAAVGDGRALGVRVTFVVQDRPLGLAHAVATARPALGDEPFAMVLGDNVIEDDLGPAARRFLAGDQAAALFLAEVDDPRSFGVAIVDDAGHVTGLVEKPQEPPSRLALVGVYLFRAAIFDAIAGLRPSARGELEITEAVNALLARGAPVGFERLRGFWLDTGKKDDVLRATAVVLDHRLAVALEGEVDAGSRLEGPVRVEPGARIERSRVIGPCVIGRGARVIDATVGPHVAVGDGARIERSAVARSVLMERAAIEDARVEGVMLGRRAVMRAATGDAASGAIGDDGVVELPRGAAPGR